VTVLSSAGFSRTQQYRYWLKREWSAALPSCAFIGLNPSTADASCDDPTIRRIIGFAQNWGYGSVTVVNLFAYRATQPSVLKAAENPVGPRNNYWIRRVIAEADTVIAAWGNHGLFMGRNKWALDHIYGLYCLGITKRGQPRHPLYCPREAVLEPLRG